MTRALVILTVAIGLEGCATMTRIGLPAPSAPPVRSAEIPPAAEPATAPPAVPELEKPPTSRMTPAPAPAKPVPPVAAVPPPPAPVAPPPAPTPPSPAPAPPPRVLAPQVSIEDERRIQGEAQRRIDRTERLVRQIDGRRLGSEQQQNLLTVQSFLAKAREALGERDVQRAMTLADKASILADELMRTMR